VFLVEGELLGAVAALFLVVAVGAVLESSFLAGPRILKSFWLGLLRLVLVVEAF